MPQEFAGWSASRFRDAASGPSRARSCATPLHRAERRLDAELRQCQRPCRQRHDGRYLGDGRLLRADRQGPSPVGRRRHRRRVGALQAEPVIIEDDCFIGARSRSSKASSSSRERCSRWAPSSARRQRSSTARPARSSPGGSRPIRLSCGFAARPRIADGGPARAFVRGHGQAGRRRTRAERRCDLLRE